MVEPNITWAKDQPDGGVGENMAVYTPGNGLGISMMDTTTFLLHADTPQNQYLD